MGAMYNLNGLDEETDYIIFDECDPEALWDQYKFWIGAENKFNAIDEDLDKYTTKRTIKWEKPCIWLSNTDPTVKRLTVSEPAVQVVGLLADLASVRT
jgi:hypothetical protein